MTILTNNGLVLVAPDMNPGAYLHALQLQHLCAHIQKDNEKYLEFAWMTEEMSYES